MNKNLRILHIIPTSYGGGVETAGKSFLQYVSNNYQFEVFFLKDNKKKNSFLSYINSFIKIININPDIVLTSLWKSNLVVILIKIINFKIKYILFLHSTRNKHFIDGIITTLAALFAYEIWADSEETFTVRINSLYIFRFYKNLILKKNKKRIISFITKKICPLKQNQCKPSFIYWGRLCPDKNIDKSIELFSKIYFVNKNSTFLIIGPDYGAKSKINKKIIKLGLEKNVSVIDFVSFEEIKKYAKKASFFIQLSSYEGMAMSVTESMQLGLIPLVTNVGQIKIYCKNLQNSLIYNENDQEMIENIFELIKNREKFMYMRKNILDTWSNCKIYKDDIISSLDQIVNI